MTNLHFFFRERGYENNPFSLEFFTQIELVNIVHCIVVCFNICLVLCLISGLDPDNSTRYTTDFSGAAPLCSAYGGTFASPAHLQQAFDNGYDMYAWGWLNDASLR